MLTELDYMKIISRKDREIASLKEENQYHLVVNTDLESRVDELEEELQDCYDIIDMYREYFARVPYSTWKQWTKQQD